MRLIDLSVAVELNDGEPVPVEIDRVSHAEGADILGRSAGIGRGEFPDGMGLSLEHVRLTSHTGTHIDAPLHYGPLCAGLPARSIDELPLSWFFGPGVLLRCRGSRADGPVAAAEVEAALDDIGYTLRPGDIVLLDTGADQWWGTPEYFTDFRGVTREATAWILDRGIHVIGIDSFGFDQPFAAMLDAYTGSGDATCLWPAHMLGREREYCQIERLANLAAVNVTHGFRIACFPIKLRGCGAAWSRVVAILDQPVEDHC